MQGQSLAKISAKIASAGIAIVIPARIGSTRLPQKLLEKIGGKSVIEHVVSRVKNVSIGELFVATDSSEIAFLVNQAGAIAVFTDSQCPTGSDRIYQALQRIDGSDRFEYIINVQGDMPFIDPSILAILAARLVEGHFDIVTPFVRIGQEEARLPENVKIVKDKNYRALYFSRAMIPHGGKEFLYHVGIYGYKRAALERFVHLNRGVYEECESLEQLRALEDGMSIGLVESQQVPISIDTAEDLEKARIYFHNKN